MLRRRNIPALPTLCSSPPPLLPPSPAPFLTQSILQLPLRLASLVAVTNWVVMCATSSSGEDSSVLINGEDTPTSDTGKGPEGLKVNAGRKSNEKSDFEVLELVTFDR